MTDFTFGVVEDAANDARSCAGCSGAFLAPSPPAEKATARKDQASGASGCERERSAN
jgi:hypothetical protein